MSAHHDLGPSGSERWMKCPGSVALLQELRVFNADLLPTDEEDYQIEGHVLHEATAELMNSGDDAWVMAGEVRQGVKFGLENGSAIQLCIDTMRATMGPDTKTFVEYRISAPELHPEAFGTLDFGAVTGHEITIVDCKYGKGVVVDVQENSQLMYYAFGLLRLFPDVEMVTITIVQPRAFHADGPVRSWRISADDIRDWALTVLGPAMHRTYRDNSLDAGAWCRFCPAKLVCPMLKSLFDAACTYDPTRVVEVNDAVLGQSWNYVKAVKHYLTALEKEVLKRLNAGGAVPGCKLVPKRANRVWKSDASDHIVTALGPLAFEPQALRSPAEIEKMGGSAAELVKRWAFTPESGLTVAAEDDSRPAVKMRRSTEVFADAVTKLTEFKT